MSNRLEQEFPRTIWHVTLPTDMDSMQYHLAHGRRLHARALNETLARLGRAGFAAVRRWIATVVAFGGYVVRSHSEPRSGKDSRTAGGSSA